MFVVHLPTNIGGIVLAFLLVFISHLPRNPSGGLRMLAFVSSVITASSSYLASATRNPQGTSMCLFGLAVRLHFIG
jgi:hypothetical protein